MSFFIFTLLYTYTYIINLIIYILSTLYLHIYSVFFKKQSFVKNIFIQNIINNSVNFLFVPKKLNGDKNNKNNFYNLYSKNNLVKYKYIYYINLYFNSIHTNHIYNYFSIYYSYNNCVVIKNNLNSFDNFRKNFLNNIYILKTGKLKNQKKHTHKIIYIFKNNYIYKLSLQVTTKYNKYITMYNISFSVSNIIKYLSKYNININFLRKNKVFNKGRYSRNRQTYRTGVYWCLYINIIAIIAFYFWFYKFSINFGYCWWFFFIFMLLFIVPRSLKYKYYNMYNILLEFYNYYLWVFSFMVLNYNLIFIFFKKFKGNTNTIFFKIFFFKHINVIIIFYKLTIDFLILLQKKFN